MVLKLHELSFSVKKKHFSLYLDPRSHISLRTTDAVLLLTKTKLSGHSSSIFTFRAENIQHMKKTHFCIVNKTLMLNEQFSFCQAIATLPRQISLALVQLLKTTNTREINGLTSDFYKVFINYVSRFLLAVYEEAVNKGSLPASLRQGVITLIPKRPKDILLLDNW